MVEKLVKEYLAEKRMMQIASVNGDQPWICTVYFVADEHQNLYWLSLPKRRHSQEIKKNNKVAIAIPVKFDKPVIGIQTEGVAEVVADSEVVKVVMEKYVEKYGQGKDFYDNFVAGKMEHSLYKFTPKRFALFDEVHFSTGDPQEWIFDK